MTEPREPVDLTAIRARIVSGQADDDEVESIIDALLALVRQKDAALEKIARSADEYLEYLHGTGSLGADEFQILKGRTITLACGARAALALSRDERTR